MSFQLVCNQELAVCKVVWVYMAVTSLIGWAVTYYFDREDNHKLHTILRYAMKLLGLGFVAFSTSVPGISLSICLALVLADLQWCVLTHIAYPPPSLCVCMRA